ncbi:phosphohistidine phosphatase SixA [Leptolyngbya sp. AN02str]|uniref:phosphohistidine phosphatase SixA n=1 Tax=Leptolyngbya sp. AN02str TaxID=3423363 RepID=UPI003D31E07B
MSLELYIIRHGLAGEHGSYANDNERPLTEEGVRKTQQVAQRLLELGLKFDVLLTSPLVRARQTAEILQQAGLSKHLDESATLAPGGSLQEWLGWLDTWRNSAKGDRIAIVGHEPGLSEWAEQLAWGSIHHCLVLKKAGVIGLSLPSHGTPLGQSELFWLTPPRFLLQ